MQGELPLPNLLPFDGLSIYEPTFLNKAAADHYFHLLQSDIQWAPDEVTIFGKTIITKRKVAWYGDPNLHYTYSGKTRVTIPWTSDLLNLKNEVEEHCGQNFNSCLLNFYHSGKEGMGWHSDDEKELGSNPTIASVSLGASRKFRFRHKSSGEIVSITLDHGSLLIMSGETQHHWQHELPKMNRIADVRINLTFRVISHSLPPMLQS